MDWTFLLIGIGLLIGGSLLLRRIFQEGKADGSISGPIRNFEESASWRRYAAEFGIAMGGFWISRTLIEALFRLQLEGFTHMILLILPTIAIYFAMHHLLWQQA